MIVLGIDYGAVTTPAGMPFNIRLERIYDGVSELMEKYKPEAMSIEKLFYNNNAKTVIDVSQARGVLVLAAQKHRIPIFEYNTTVFLYCSSGGKASESRS